MSKKKIPCFALVGRPNVGKSSLFNSFAQQSLAIIDNHMGTTRDCIYSLNKHKDIPYFLIDTAGLYPHEEDLLSDHIFQKTQEVLKECHAIFFVVDAKEGLHLMDEKIAKDLRKYEKTCYILVNKVDHKKQNNIVDTPFFKLGFQENFSVSAKNKLGLDNVLSTALAPWNLKKTWQEESNIHIAFLGRPNVGKSSLLNSLANKNKILVSEQPGTTRDSIDIHIKRDQKQFVFIDTAGLRYRRKIQNKIEISSVKKTIQSLKRADICLVLLNAEEGLTTQDLKIIKLIDKEKKPCAVLLNKWDLFPNCHQKDFIHEEMEALKAFPYLSYLFLSAKTKKNIFHIFDLIEKIELEKKKRISTGILNRFIQKIILKNPPPYQKNKRLKIYYVSQVDTIPPIFLFSINNKSFLTMAYQRYLKNQIYAHFGFSGCPIILKFSQKTPQ